MSKPNTLENMLRLHDQAIYDWLDGLKIDYGSIEGTPIPSKGILRVYASPRRAFATMYQVLVRKGWMTADNASPDSGGLAKLYKNVPLPFCSIARPDVSIDMSRAGSPKIINIHKQEGDTEVIEKHNYPKPWDLSYQIDFWCLKKYTEAHIYEWLMSQISAPGSAPNELFLTIHHAEPWGDKLTALRIESWSDNSDLEDLEDTDRFLRFTLTCTLRARCFVPPSETVKPIYFTGIDFHNAIPVNNPPKMETIRPISGNLIKYHKRDVDKEEKICLVYTASTGVTINSVPEMYEKDGRPIVNWDMFSLTYTSSTDKFYTDNIVIPTTFVLLSGSIYVYDNGQQPNVFVDLIDSDSNVLLHHKLTFVKEGWYRFEKFMPSTQGKVRIVIYPDKNNTTIVVKALSISVVGSQVAVENKALISNRTVVANTNGYNEEYVISSLNNYTKYLFTAKILTLTGTFAIILTNSGISPTYQEEIICEPNQAKVMGLFIMPLAVAGVGNSSITYRIEHRGGTVPATIELSEISLRKLTANTRGNRVPE